MLLKRLLQIKLDLMKKLNLQMNKLELLLQKSYYLKAKPLKEIEYNLHNLNKLDKLDKLELYKKNKLDSNVNNKLKKLDLLDLLKKKHWKHKSIKRHLFH